MQRVTQWSRVMESEVFMGSARSRSRAPQYLMKAMLAGAAIRGRLLIGDGLPAEPGGSEVNGMKR